MKKLGFLLGVFVLCAFGESSLCAQDRKMTPFEAVYDTADHVVATLDSLIRTLTDKNSINTVRQLLGTTINLLLISYHNFSNSSMQKSIYTAVRGIEVNLLKSLPVDAQGIIIKPQNYTTAQRDSVIASIQNINKILPPPKQSYKLYSSDDINNVVKAVGNLPYVYDTSSNTIKSNPALLKAPLGGEATNQNLGRKCSPLPSGEAKKMK